MKAVKTQSRNGAVKPTNTVVEPIDANQWFNALPKLSARPDGFAVIVTADPEGSAG
jgi:hypothetical protein